MSAAKKKPAEADVTPWFSILTSPLRPGWYEAKYSDLATRRPYPLNFWSGMYWYIDGAATHRAAFGGDATQEYWRGLRRPPLASTRKRAAK